MTYPWAIVLTALIVTVGWIVTTAIESGSDDDGPDAVGFDVPQEKEED